MAQYSIGEAIKVMLDQSSWKYAYQLTLLTEDWEKIVGKTIAKYTSNLQIRGKVLYMTCSAAPLKSELNYNKKMFVDKINEHFGEEFIRDIIIS